MKLWHKALALIALALAPFFLLEAGLRLSGYRLQFPYQDDPDLAYALAPDYHGPGPELYGIARKIDLRVNELGFRGEEAPASPEEGVIRIVAIGDSCTFGLGLEEDHTYPFLAQHMLQESAAPGVRYEVLNAGVPGYTSYQGVQMLEHRVLELKPRVVLFYFGWNDHWFSDRGRTDEQNHDAMHEFLVKRSEKHRGNILRSLRLYQVLTDVLLRAQDNTRKKTLHPKPDVTVFRVPLQDFQKNLEKAVEISRAHGIQILLLTPPHGFFPGKIPKEYLIENYMKRDDSLIALHESYIDAVRQVSAKTGAPLIDMARFFEGSDRKSLMEADGIHPNATGQRIIAAEVAKAIRTSLAGHAPKAASH